MNRPRQSFGRPALFLFAAFLAASCSVAQATQQQSVPAAPLPQQDQPAPAQTVQGNDVKNMPAYQSGSSQNQQPKPDTTIVSGPPATVPVPAAKPLPAAPQKEAQQPTQAPAQPPYAPYHRPYNEFVPSQRGSIYIPLDSWIYPAMLRLYSLGYLDTAFLGMRPWTRLSALHILSLTAERLDAEEAEDSEARQIYDSLVEALASAGQDVPARTPGDFTLATVYTRMMGIGGESLRDSFHVGDTLVNDYGRPYAQGFSNITGISTSAEKGRFSFYFRGEYQRAPGYTGYDPTQVQTLEMIDTLPAIENTPTVPAGSIGAANNFRIVEGDIAAHFIGTEFSFGKHDEWLGPAYGASFAWSNNAEAIYSFQINRVEPLYIPGLSRILGPVRYQFFVGSLKGHTAPNDPWTHMEKFAFRPTDNFEFGFSRTVIWGGEQHEAINLKSFFRSFFSINDTQGNEKDCFGVVPTACADPGARFSQFDFSWRLPYLRKYLTFYTDTEVHDDVTPPSAPRRSAFRTGLYLAKVPALPRFDFRVEAVSTDPNTSRSINGSFMYWETVQKNGYTNAGQIMGDWIGREAKGGQAWATYHLSPSEMLQVSYRNAKGAKDFVPGGTTQNDFTATVVKRFHKDLELNAWVQVERWNVPFLKPGTQTDTTGTVQFTWFPTVTKQF